MDEFRKFEAAAVRVAPVWAAKRDYNWPMKSRESTGHRSGSELTPKAQPFVPPDSEQGHMMLVSPNFDILMMHPAFEAIWRRPVSSFLGKKCYRELEKRDEPCPYCPGVIALQTGAASEAETRALLDDGTRVPFLLRAYPVYGVNGEPAGFVEVAEDITDRRRREDDTHYDIVLMKELLGISSTSRMLLLGLDAALRLDSVDAGCVFAIDPHSRIPELVSQRGFLTDEIESLLVLITNTTITALQGAPPLVRVPILSNRGPVAELVVRLRPDTQAWPSDRSRLEAVAAIIALGIARIHAERSRGDAGANMQTLLKSLPTAILFIDFRGMVTVWNEGSEQMFGFTEVDARGKAPPFLPEGEEEHFFSLVAKGGDPSQSPWFQYRCLNSGGDASDVWFRAEPVYDVIGDGTSHVVVAAGAEAGTPWGAESNAGVSGQTHSASPHASGMAVHSLDGDALGVAQALGRLFAELSSGLQLGQRFLDKSAAAGTDVAASLAGGSLSLSWDGDGALGIHASMPASVGRSTRTPEAARALVIQSEENNGRLLERILNSLGCSTTICSSTSSAIEHLRCLRDLGESPNLAIVEIVMPQEPAGGVETCKLLKTIEPRLRVIVTSEHGVAGYRSHGFEATMSRPYTNEAVTRAVTEALGQATQWIHPASEATRDDDPDNPTTGERQTA